MPCILLHLTARSSTIIYTRRQMDTPSSQSSTDALHTATPTARSSTMHIYRRQMDPPVNQAQMHCILLHPLLDLDPQVHIDRIDALHMDSQSKHRCISYCYTLTARYSTMHIHRRLMNTPQTIKHRCLAYCYTHSQI